jgi:hypothetical protein
MGSIKLKIPLRSNLTAILQFRTNAFSQTRSVTLFYQSMSITPCTRDSRLNSTLKLIWSSTPWKKQNYKTLSQAQKKSTNFWDKIS